MAFRTDCPAPAEQELQGCVSSGCCSFIPPDILEFIATAPAAADRQKALAKNTLVRMTEVHRARAARAARAAPTAGSLEPSGPSSVAGAPSFIPINVYEQIINSDRASAYTKERAKLNVQRITALEKGLGAPQIPSLRSPIPK